MIIKTDTLSIALSKRRVSRNVEISENVFAGFDPSGQILEVQFF
ncbi:MAG: hypothetical protein OXJ52_08570 [Oligoflexia bacterium]|nr:hypothetical protein [Oligoflexia bacterium]